VCSQCSGWIPALKRDYAVIGDDFKRWKRACEHSAAYAEMAAGIAMIFVQNSFVREPCCPFGPKVAA
jgi:hypothetical protein